MPASRTLSRRKAASMLAGVFVASAGSALADGGEAVFEARVPLDPDLKGPPAGSYRRMLELLSSVRGATGPASLDKAFDRFKGAFVAHYRKEAIAGFAKPARREEQRSNGLYRQEDPSFVLARVIVRELEARPRATSAWSRRLDDLGLKIVSALAQTLEVDYSFYRRCRVTATLPL